ncbi:uncharacterized protein BJX67DRAFT_307322 [Aspergillus lucknowensis]|uniref:Uncharacterized protein n=1 Tax=Aspergillus lucknowensis TaxID=176173 RepID=A0ABR4LZX6_9EURO
MRHDVRFGICPVQFRGKQTALTLAEMPAMLLPISEQRVRIFTLHCFRNIRSATENPPPKRPLSENSLRIRKIRRKNPNFIPCVQVEDARTNADPGTFTNAGLREPLGVTFGREMDVLQTWRTQNMWQPKPDDTGTRFSYSSIPSGEITRWKPMA